MCCWFSEKVQHIYTTQDGIHLDILLRFKVLEILKVLSIVNVWTSSSKGKVKLVAINISGN